jgi:hypothetical protein
MTEAHCEALPALESEAPARALAVMAPAHLQPASPLDLPAEVFRAGLDRRKANRAALMEWVRAALVEGVDFGRIHTAGKSKCQYAARGLGSECPDARHWSKPSLFKPGAEKISGMLGVTVHYPTLHDYEQAALHGVDIKHVILRCEIRDAASRVVADGVGARTLSQDYGDLNKALKMAEKSAHIDAALRMAGLSEVFTQDIEDMKGGFGNDQGKQDSAGVAAGDEGAEAQGAAAAITEAQRRRLEARLDELGLERERVKDWLRRATRGRVGHFADMTTSDYAILDGKLAQWTQEQPA